MRVVLFSFLVAQACFAGVVISGKLTQNGVESPIKQYYQAANARIEYQGAGSPQRSALLYRGASGSVAIVDLDRKSYIELKEADLDRLGGLLTALASRNGKAGKAGGKQISFRQEKGEHTVGKWTCKKHAILSGTKKTGTVCVVPMNTVGLASADLSPLVSLVKNFLKLGPLAQQNDAFLGMGVEQALKLGFSVEAVALDARGKTSSRFVVDSVTKEDAPDSLFAPPAGFAKNDIGPLLMQGKSSRK